MVERSESIEKLNGSHDGLSCWRVEEVEADEIVDSEGLEEKNHAGEIGSLNLGDGVGLELVVKRPLGVKTKALASADSSCSAGSLVSRSSGALQVLSGRGRTESQPKGAQIKLRHERRTGDSRELR